MTEGEVLQSRIEAKVQYDTNGGCWLWMGALQANGHDMDYACIRWGGKTHRATRLVCSLIKGESIEGKVVRHTCDVSLCVNPDHLILGTHKDNMADMITRGRKNPSRGEGHYRARFSDKKCLEMKRRHEAGETVTEIARSEGVRHRESVNYAITKRAARIEQHANR